jgi:hypothetical protein
MQDPELDFNETLRMEMGWGDVASGLTKVLVGYATMFLGVTIGTGLVVFALYGLGEEFSRRAQNHAKPNLSHLWALYSGLGILSVIGLVSYTIILGGQFRCMMGAAERNGARWFMFTCIVCVFLGPMFHIASGIASWQAVNDLRANPHRFESFQLNPIGQWLQLIGFGISMLYPLCFVLFLRAVAICLGVEWHVMLINVFVVIGGAMVVGTGYMLYQYRPGTRSIPPEQAVILALGWGVVLLLYVGLIALTRIAIQRVMGQVKSPLET